ncbi:c-type cytochrome [Edaphobacter aggregans]|uniref:c-type cytochrome n=1 Tax=Edaphobacter aggregans TaxID=570835 RepID=UPI00068D1D3B|nr:c-type cytochrome [Edaphobacter aggregans]
MDKVMGLLLAASAGALLLAGCKKADREPSPAVPPSYSLSAIPADAQGERIRFGRAIFDETPGFAPAYTGAKISCGDCHTQSGTAAYAAPMVDLAGMFPMYNQRAGRVIGLEERIQECFTRSENGKPLPPNSQEMLSLVAYINWLSRDGVKGAPYKGRGLVKLPEMVGNISRGKQEYASQCAGCHGADGAGVPPVLPPVWGPDSYNNGAGMNNPEKTAAFLLHNMPQNHPGTLTTQQAFDVAAYLHAMPRPKFNESYKGY